MNSQRQLESNGVEWCGVLWSGVERNENPATMSCKPDKSEGTLTFGCHGTDLVCFVFDLALTAFILGAATGQNWFVLYKI